MPPNPTSSSTKPAVCDETDIWRMVAEKSNPRMIKTAINRCRGIAVISGNCISIMPVQETRLISMAGQEMVAGTKEDGTVHAAFVGVLAELESNGMKIHRPGKLRKSG